MENAETGELTGQNIPDFSLRSKDGFIPSYVYLDFPNTEEIEDIRARQLAGLDAFMLGALADQGKLFQNVTGVEPIELKITDFPPYPLKIEQSIPLFSIDDSTIKFIKPRTRILTDDKNNISVGRVKDWFLRSVTLWNRFMRYEEAQDLLSLRVGKISFPINREGLKSAWKASNLPKFVNPVLFQTQLHIPHKY